jgi:hypothetical protein
VERLFHARGIQYAMRTLHLGATQYRGVHAYTFLVPENQFDLAISVLKDWIGLGAEPALYTGECPACGCAVEDAARCPDCDLNLSGSYSEVTPRHPFLAFLKHEKLL